MRGYVAMIFCEEINMLQCKYYVAFLQIHIVPGKIVNFLPNNQAIISVRKIWQLFHTIHATSLQNYVSKKMLIHLQYLRPLVA